MNPCTMAIWKCQVTGMLARAFIHEGNLYVYDLGTDGWRYFVTVGFSSDADTWDFWSHE